MDIVLFILSFALILIGCEFFTNGIEWLGKRFNLSEGCIGSVLAAVGTAMPETLIPIIALLFLGGEAGQEIGVGAILGAPFMLSTLALFVCGLSVFLFMKRKGRRTLRVNGKLIRRDLKFFLIAYSLALVAAFVPLEFSWIKWIIGVVFIPLYVYYTYITVKCRDGQCENGNLKCLYFQRAIDKALGNGRNASRTGVEDPIGEKLRKAVYEVEPPTYLIFVQVAMGLMAIILGANIFVEQIREAAIALGMNPLILALILAPVATELPEKFNSFLWIREGKDTYAIGNITGAMVFQSCIPVTIGIVATDWHIVLWNTTQFLQSVSMGISILAASILYLRSSHSELRMSGLMLGGLFYLFFIILVLVSV